VSYASLPSHQLDVSEQAPAGWYPDGYGNERYWGGSAWTEQLRRPAATPPKKGGAFAKVGAAVKKAAAEKRAAKEELSRKQAENAQAAGNLVTSGVFGTSTVEIYDGGYVRVASWADGMQAASITKNTPYERLRSIKFTPAGQDNAGSGMTSALKGTVGPAVAALMKGGAGLMKGSAPGLAVAGVAYLAGNEGRKSFLTIATDKEIHTLTNQSSNSRINKSNKGHNEVGVALEAAGNAVLGVVGVAAQQSASEPHSVVVSQAAAGPTLAERFRELADLHNDGILSDGEFAAAKAKLLGGL
jgi:hypothetical protein